MKPNYDPAYVLPRCDLCGEELDPPEYYVDLEISPDKEGIDVTEHEGHLCHECANFDDQWFQHKARKFRFHFVIEEDELRLLMVDLQTYPQVNSSHFEPIYKYSRNNVPAPLRDLGFGLAKHAPAANGAKGAENSEGIQEVYEKNAEVRRQMLDTELGRD